MRAQELSIKAEMIYALGTANAADLLPRGVDAARLASLRTSIDNFDKSVGMQGTGLAKQVSATKSVNDLLKEADELIHEEINGLVENLREDYPDFCVQYEAARQIKDLGTRHNPPDENPPPTPPAS